MFEFDLSYITFETINGYFMLYKKFYLQKEDPETFIELGLLAPQPSMIFTIESNLNIMENCGV